MKRILFIGTILAWTFAAPGDEHFATLKAGSEVYSNVTVTSATASQIYFTHSGGIGGAKLKDLDAGLQTHFHYDAKTATTAELRRNQEDAQYRQQLASITSTSRSSASFSASAGSTAITSDSAAQVQTVTKSSSSRGTSARATVVAGSRSLPPKLAPPNKPSVRPSPPGQGRASSAPPVAPPQG